MSSLTDAIGLDCRTGGPGGWAIGGTGAKAMGGNSKGGRWCRKGDKPFTENRAQPSFIGADMPAIKLTPKQIGENKQRRKNWQMQLETNMADFFIIFVIGGIMIGMLVCVIHMMPHEESWAASHVSIAM